MIGLEVEVNGKMITGAVEKGVSTIVLTNVQNGNDFDIEIDFDGLLHDKDNSSYYLKWLNSTLKEGDVIRIKVKNVECLSKPISEEKISNKQLMEEKLRSYNELKENLKEKGLL